MIEQYCAPTPNGWKISIMLEELGLPYMVIPDNIRAGEPFRPEFLAISPNNRVPAVSSAGLTCDRQVRKLTVRRRGAAQHVRPACDGAGGEEVTSALSVRDAPLVPTV